MTIDRGVREYTRGGSLIVRVLQGRVHSEHLASFRAQAQEALANARRQDGLIYAQLGRQSHPDGGEQVLFVSVWCDLDCLYRWIGGTDLLDTPVLGNGDPSVFEHFEVQHYETYDELEEDFLEGEGQTPDARAFRGGLAGR